ncbi:hypothetical protein [Bradyrhizobium jicamae]|uniref:hypothetical protein n=1 Tax=Bradyrhizobium jicamae TaxID=280332 RepID=UPI000A91818B|nr:hypothetical protein [Bradyrhizobium jicamae]
MRFVNTALKLVATAQPADIDVAVASNFSELTKETAATIKNTRSRDSLSFGANCNTTTSRRRAISDLLSRRCATKDARHRWIRRRESIYTIGTFVLWEQNCGTVI